MNKQRRTGDLSECAEQIYYVIVSTCLLAFVVALVVIEKGVL